MSLFVGNDLGKAFGALDVFDGIDLRIEAGDRIGMVGANGAGKTTLLRILAGVDTSTAGDVFRKRGLTVGYLPQDPPPAGRHDPARGDAGASSTGCAPRATR